MTFQIRNYFRLKQSLKSLANTLLFDESYYLDKYLDVNAQSMSAGKHYLLYGAAEGRNPSLFFDTVYYLKQSPDLNPEVVNPLVHYLEHGASEGRNPHPLFDSSYYLDHNPDVAKSGMNPLEHFLQFGAVEGRSPHPLFRLPKQHSHHADLTNDDNSSIVTRYFELGEKEVIDKPAKQSCANSRNDKFVLKLSSSFDRGTLTERLKKYEPWGHRIDFDNGVSTRDLKRRVPFTDYTLLKLHTVSEKIPFESFRGGTLLDIGCNSGYNSIFAATKYGMKPVGIDVVPRHIEVSRLLSEMSGVSGEYFLANAEIFSRPDAFDVILHFGTLYHLKNPILSLETTFANLRSGGYLALETQVYEHPDDENICYFMYLQNNDKTNFWALSLKVLIQLLEMIGFEEIQVLVKTSNDLLEQYMLRVIVVAHKPTILG